jgi:2-methylcitrate dehydratase PrpD
MKEIAMSLPESATPGRPGTTRELANWVSGFEGATPTARLWARHALLDWAAVTVAGSREPLAGMMVEEFGAPTGPCTLVATGRRAAPHDAALVNGAVGHALDYDDVHFAMHGHPTVPVAPVVLALGEALGRTGRDVLDAFVAGYEAECQIGAMAGFGHYDKGFHATGTIGTFGAAAAASWLLRLDAGRTANALGMAAAQAAGLKAMFGTMTKPFHAGKAAANGLVAARLAARGFTANTAGIEAPQGFAVTQAPGFAATQVRPDPEAPFAIEGNLFKYHAACYLTHSAIEAIGKLRERHGVRLDDLKALTVFAEAAIPQVCDIRAPRTGLEVKFSIRHLAALALDGADTAALDLYTDAVAADARLSDARAKICVERRAFPSRSAAAVALETRNGRTLVAEADVGVPAADTGAQWVRLTAKARSIAVPVIGADRVEAVIGAVDRLEQAGEVTDLMRLLA